MKESRTIQLAVAAIALVGLLAVALTGLLAWEGKDTPDALSAAAGAAVGALATLLTTYSPGAGQLPGGRRATDPPP